MQAMKQACSRRSVRTASRLSRASRNTARLHLRCNSSAAADARPWQSTDSESENEDHAERMSRALERQRDAAREFIQEAENSVLSDAKWSHDGCAAAVVRTAVRAALSANFKRTLAEGEEHRGARCLVQKRTDITQQLHRGTRSMHASFFEVCSCHRAAAPSTRMAPDDGPPPGPTIRCTACLQPRLSAPKAPQATRHRTRKGSVPQGPEQPAPCMLHAYDGAGPPAADRAASVGAWATSSKFVASSS